MSKLHIQYGICKYVKCMFLLNECICKTKSIYVYKELSKVIYASVNLEVIQKLKDICNS